ncbi:hypothetical protein VPH35_119335 [Triticum aestivum]
MNLVPEFDDDPVEDDFYGFSDNEIERVEDDIDSNQEVVPPRFKEIERVEDDIDSNQEVVPHRFKEDYETDAAAAQFDYGVDDPSYLHPPRACVPPMMFYTEAEEVVVLCDEEDVLLYAQLRLYNIKLPPYWPERVEVMRTQADESGTHADELLAEYDMLLQELELEMGFQEDQFSALAVSTIVHEEINVLSNELSVETNHHFGNLDIISLEHERLAIQEDFQLVLEDSDRLNEVALGLRRCAAHLTEGEEEGEEVEFLPQEQEAAEVILLEIKPNQDEDWWPDNPRSVQQVKEQQTLEEVPESWEDRL